MDTSNERWRALAALGAAWAALSACELEQTQSQPTPQTRTEALLTPGAALGKKLFEQPFRHTNGRACASCHVLDEATTLRPESVAARLRENPDDPLFARIDADDPNAGELTFEHLKKGLVRVVLPLPDNMDVIDFAGNVITPSDRTIFVWRGVPSVADTAFTGPFQIDGREATLQSQARSAILSHSQGREVADFALDRLAEFQRSVFTSPRARFISTLLKLGVPEPEIPLPEHLIPLSDAEKRGREVYEAACQSCHGGATTDRIAKREVVDFFFVALTPEGNVRFEQKPGQPPRPAHVARPGVEFMNVGFGALSYAGQIGFAPTFNASLELPRYRFRFYRDATRAEPLVDLPPTPKTVSGDPFDLRPASDENGFPIVGPNLIPQQFTTDPGRAVITGDPADFEAFDIPTLRGVAHTAPYFHDNSRETLREVINEYSIFVLPAAPPLGLPAIFPPEQPGGQPQSLSPEQKADLLRFLERL